MCEGGDCDCPRRHEARAACVVTLTIDEAERLLSLIQQTKAEEEFDKRTLPTWERIERRIRAALPPEQERQ
jgi:hypothetical protein